ncbi:hypothetical protein ACJA3J_15150 [Halobacillus sp. SY10]|uniref:hypothetical protein n=1 Tax=Halobacillus sp. SY10 TaxID=3381356 RepID=UPI00387931F1
MEVSELDYKTKHVIEHLNAMGFTDTEGLSVAEAWMESREEMKLLELIGDFEITLNGGASVYALLCMFIVFVLGISETLTWIISLLL